jgi:hypothetical protein
LLRDLIRLPFRRFAIDTELSQAEIAERLRGIVEPGSVFLAGFRRTNKPFGGKFSSQGFKLMRLVSYVNIFEPVIIGRLKPVPRGTRVQVTMRPRQSATIFGILWFGSLSFIVFVALLETVFSSRRNEGRSPLEGVRFAFGVGVFAYLVVAACFGAAARKARGLLEEALQPTPGPRVQKILSGAPPRLPRLAKRLLLVVGTVAIGLVVAPYFIARSEPYQIAENYVRTDPLIEEELGTIGGVGLKILGNKLTNDGREGSARFALGVEGTRGSGTVFVAMRRHLGVWQVNGADLREASGRTVTLRSTTPDPPNP